MYVIPMTLLFIFRFIVYVNGSISVLHIILSLSMVNLVFYVVTLDCEHFKTNVPSRPWVYCAFPLLNRFPLRIADRVKVGMEIRAPEGFVSSPTNNATHSSERAIVMDTTCYRMSILHFPFGILWIHLEGLLTKCCLFPLNFFFIYSFFLWSRC